MTDPNDDQNQPRDGENGIPPVADQDIASNIEKGEKSDPIPTEADQSLASSQVANEGEQEVIK